MNKLKNVKITVKIVALVLVLQFVTMALFTYFAERNEESRELVNLDDKLRTVAYAANDFILQEYHDGIIDENSVSKEEYMNLMIRLSSFAEKVNVKYVSTMIKRNSKVLFTATSVTQEDFKTQSYELFFEEYADATDKLIDSFQGKEAFYEETTTKYGHLRTAFLPFMNKYGEVYTVAVDIDVAYLTEMYEKSREKRVLLAGVIFLISAFVTTLLINFLLKRIVVIRNALQEFFDYLNRKTTVISPIHIRSGDELGEMGSLINENIKVIASNMQKDNELISNIAGISEQMMGGSFASRIEVEGNNPALNEVKNIMNELFTNMQIVMLDILNVLQEFSKQNYNCKLSEYDLDGEMGKLVFEITSYSKYISDYMLNTAYDSINLEKDSSFLNEYIEGLTQKLYSHLKDVHHLKEVLQEAKRFHLKGIESIQKIDKENLYAMELLNKLQEKTKEAFDVEEIFSKREKLGLDFQIDEIINDISQSMKLISQNKGETQRFSEQTTSLMHSLGEGFDLHEERIRDVKKSIDQTQKVSSNLKQLSQRMRDYIEKSDFAGKESINILINNTDR